MMKQEDLFKKIGSILQELQEQYEFLAQNPQQLNELELELFQANASFLSDHIQIIKKINNSKPVKELPAPDPELMPATPVKPVLDELFKPDHEAPTFEFVMNEQPLSDKFDFEEKPVYEIFDRPLSPEEQEIIRRKQELLSNQEHAHPLDIPAVPAAEILTQPAVEQEPEELQPSAAAVQEEIAAVNEQTYQVSEIQQTPDDAETENLSFDFTSATEAESTPAAHATTFQPEVEELAAAELIVEESVAEEDEDEIGPEPFLVVEEPPAAPEVTEPALAHTEVPATKPTLNEMLAANASASNNYSFERSRLPITDLKGAINLNQKLLYIKDLFNGYNLAYAEVIDILNKMPDFKTADHFLQSNYAVKNNWASKPGTVEQFYELLRLRFPD